MAEVWKAKVRGPAGFRRTLVIKRILPHLVEDPHFVSMFVKEARLCARLNHANIVQVFELGDVDGEYFLAMEYVRGHDLSTTVRAQLQKAPPPPGLGTLVVREVCRALGYAHSLCDDDGTPLRLIHRDVTPSNVMLGFDGAVKLLDFGIAKALSEASENKTQTGTLKGKFGYLSPELVEGREVDHRTDIFATGVMLHEALTGRRLFKGASDLQTLAMVREAKAEPPSLLNPLVPEELDRICMKALARRVEDRYPTCDDMAMELDEVLHQLKWGPERLAATMRELFPEEPVTAPSSAGLLTDVSGVTVGVLRRHERRRRAAFAAAGLATLGGLAWLVAAKISPGSDRMVADPVPLADPTPVAAPPPAPTPNVSVRVTSDPPGAQVYLGNDPTPKGQTPLFLSVGRSVLAQRVTLKARGFKPVSTDFTPDADSRLQLTLPRDVPAAPLPTAGQEKKARKRPTGKRAADSSAPARPEAPQPDLRKGDVVDPFK
jgi:serine/threonine protein kinase